MSSTLNVPLGSGASVTVSDTPPGTPAAGDLWWDSINATMMVYYNDGDSSQWIEANPGAAGNNVNSIGTSGTFTPTLSFGGASVGMTYSAQIGRYIRQGNLVWYSLQVSLSNKGTSVGTAQIGGLPITAIDVTLAWIASVRMFNGDASLGSSEIVANSNGNNTNISLRYMSSGSAQTMTNSHFSNSTIINVTGYYEVE